MYSSLRILIRSLRRLVSFPVAITLLLFVVGVIASGSVQAASGGEEHRRRSGYSEYDPTPTGALRVAAPVIAWHIIPTGKSHITDVKLTLNLQSVDARYDEQRQAVWYVPTTPLMVGKYTVHCTVTLDGEFMAERSWEFSILPGAAMTLSQPSGEQSTTVSLINEVRKSINQPPLIVDPRLCAAAASHSNYLALNHEVSHNQQQGRPGFVAPTTTDRVNAFGYSGGCFESISQGTKTAMAAVQGLFDAPYHRAPFLQPGAFDVGTGAKSDVITLIFGASDKVGLVTYPGDGQKDVPCQWDGEESPNPLRVHGMSHGPVGYAITLFAFGPDDPRLTVSNASLTTLDGKQIPIFLNTPDNDNFLRNGMLIIPQKPLKPGTTYRVTVKAEDDISTDRSKTWTFTTAAANLASAKH